MADEAVEIERRRRSRIGLDRRQFRKVLQPVAPPPSECDPCPRATTPFGRSTTTWISDLLSNGSSFTATSFVPNSAHTATVARPTEIRKILERDPAFQQRRGDADVEAPHRADVVAVLPARHESPRNGGRQGACSSQGVTVTATKNENSIAIDALAGIGLM